VSSATSKQLLDPPSKLLGSRLLSPDDSARLAAPLRARSTHEREHVRKTLQKVHSDWLADWYSATPNAQSNFFVRVEDASSEQPHSGAGGAALVRDLLFGRSAIAPEIGSLRTSAKAPLASEVAQKAWEAWSSSIHGAIGRTNALRPVTETAQESRSVPAPWPWSGALDVVFGLEASEWTLQLSPSEVDFVLRSADVGIASGSPIKGGALSPLKDALSLRRLSVRVEMQSLTLSLGQLQSLGVGDIVILSHSLDLPAQLKIDSNEVLGSLKEAQPLPLCQAWLGQLQGNMAVELHPTV
jgi:hypothetical protein